MKLLILALFVFLSGLAESKSLRDNKSKNAAVDDVYNDDDSYEYEYEYDDIDEGIMFECLDGSGNKIMLDYMCNGFSECDDGSDEDIVNCAVHGISKETTTTTSTTTTTTATTTPVPTTTTSTKAVKIEEPDEFDDYQDACSADEFQCKSDLGICLPKALVCDGTKDCPNSEDETDCPSENLESEYIAPLMSPEETSDEFDHNYGLDVQPRPSSLDYSRFYDTRKGEAIDHRPVLPTVPIPQIAFRPQAPVVLKKPESEKPAIFVPELQPETDEDNLNLESDYHYVIIDEYGDYKEFGDTDSVTESSTEKITALSTENNKVESSLNSVELVKNIAGNFANQESTSLTEEDKDVIIRHHSQPQENRKSDISSLSNSAQSLESGLSVLPRILGKENTDNLVKRRKKLEKQRKKVRGVVGQLLHQVGKLIENEDYSDNSNGFLSESANNLRMHTNIGVNLGLGSSNQANDLYSRILSSCSSEKRLRISIDLDL